jgi:hypothetical protein
LSIFFAVYPILCFFKSLQTFIFNKNKKEVKKIKTKPKLLLTILSFLIVLVSLNPVSAADVVVNPGDDIQSAIDNPTTQPGDTIIVNDNNGAAATYNTNININKTNITLKSNGTVTLSALDPNDSVIIIMGYSGGNGATVQGFKITGTTGDNSGIYINTAQNVKILENYIKGNYEGISIKGYSSVLVEGNYITENANDGIAISISQVNGFKILTPTSNGVQIRQNTIINNSRNGITIYDYNRAVSAVNELNVETFVSDITTHINFNRIATNGNYGLSYILYQPQAPFFAMLNGEPVYKVDAENNWWGLNNILDVSTQINDSNDKVDWIPFLIMILSPNPVVISAGGTTLITADFTKNWDGNDTSSLGHIPDGTPVYFTTNFGNLGSKFAWAETINGIASVILRGDEGAGVATITATLDEATEDGSVTVQAARTPSNGQVPMQDTGIPLIGLFIALVMILGGGIAARTR